MSDTDQFAHLDYIATPVFVLEVPADGLPVYCAFNASARAISAAGLILAATFAMVAIIPLGLFRQIAFVMAVGLLIDTFLIRPVLTPAVLTLLGPLAGWPGRRIRTSPQPGDSPEGTTDPPRAEAAPVGAGAAGASDGPGR